MANVAMSYRKSAICLFLSQKHLLEDLKPPDKLQCGKKFRFSIFARLQSLPKPR